MYDDYWSWDEFSRELSREYREVTSRGPAGSRYVFTGELPSLPTFTPEGITAWAVARLTPSYTQVDLALTIAEWRLYSALGLGPVAALAISARANFDMAMALEEEFPRSGASASWTMKWSRAGDISSGGSMPILPTSQTGEFNLGSWSDIKW